MAFDAALPEPARQPKPVATGFEGYHDPPDRPSCPHTLVPPALEQFEERRRIRLKLLLRLALEPGNDRADEPARPAQLDRRDQGGILLKGDEGTAQIIDSGSPWDISIGFCATTMVSLPRRPPHSFSGEGTAGRHG